MPPQRTPLGPISSNREFNHQLSLYQRGRIIGLVEKGVKPPEIADRLKCSRGAVRSTLVYIILRDEGEQQPRSGRPLEYTPADERNLLRHVRLNPKDLYEEYRRAYGLEIKRATIKRILRRYYIINWRARRRPYLTEKNAAKRLA